MADLRFYGRCFCLVAGLSAIGAGCTGQIDPGNGSTGPYPPTGSGGTTVVPQPKANGFIDPAARALTRLTNAEYSQAVTDLLGEPADAATRYRFPIDPRQHGFDNNSDLLQISPTHGDRYEAAAEAIATATFAAPDRRARVLSCNPADGDSCLRTFVSEAGRKIYRRPIGDSEVTDFVTLAKTATGTDPTLGMQLVLQAMLQSPNFLFRVELGAPVPNRAGVIGLTGYEMATRLAFFLWGTAPDAALLDRAQKGGLDQPADLATTITQMVADPRVHAGSLRFYGQWLPLTEISGPNADDDRIPHNDTAVAADLVTETTHFVDDVLWNGGTIPDLLTARYTFLDARLATIYAVPAPAKDWQRVDFPAGALRAGILTQGAILAAGSHTDRPSNTRRGEIVREQLLCQDIPSPPPGVNAVVPMAMGAETEQQTFARHTTDPTCASCHSLMDPIGFGLSGFDVNGAARTKDFNGQPISTKGQIQGWAAPDFDGPVDLAQKLAASDQFRTCFAQQLFRYAYARTEASNDMPGITEMANTFQGSGWSFAKGLAAFVGSDGFRYRVKGDAP